MDIGRIRNKISEQFNRLEKRQRMLVLLLIASILFSMYYNWIFKPQSSALKKVKKELVGVNNQLLRLKSQMPDIQREKEAVVSAQKRLASLKRKLEAMRSRLPTHGSIPQLLGDLVQQASGYSIDFVSIRPRTDKKKMKYPELAIEMKFNAAFSSFVNYLNRLESTSQFLRADNIVMEEMKEGMRGISSITLTLTTFLGDVKTTGGGDKGLSIAPLAIPRNPFISDFQPVAAEEKIETYTLSGIVISGPQPTAVINDEVYKIGDTLGGKELKEISANRVVLSDGIVTTVLTLE